MFIANTIDLMPRKPLPEKKVGVAAKLAPELMEFLRNLSIAEDRTISYLIERYVREARDRIEGHKPESKPRKPK